VLFGRGGRSNRHHGNTLYRHRILGYQPAYKKLDIHGKRQMSEDIVAWVASRGGRFLQCDDTPEGNRRYFVAKDEVVRAKICQALREDHTREGRRLKESRLSGRTTNAGNQEEDSEPTHSIPHHSHQKPTTSFSAVTSTEGTSTPLFLESTTATSLSVSCHVPPITPKKRIRHKELKPTERTFVYEDEVLENDVLFGRGARSNWHPGNQTYRERILDLQPLYKTKDSKGRREMSKAVVEWVNNELKGRFLAVDRTPYGNCCYYIATDEQAREKVMQSLRDDHTGYYQKKARRKTLNEKEATNQQAPVEHS
jgi:hypothetical protein